MTRLVQMRGNNIVLLDDQGKPYVEVRPYYHEGVGPAVEFRRVNVNGEAEYLFTLRLNTVNALVRKLPIVTTAAKRLQNEANKPAK
jgi:hypothetical protein